MQDVSSILAYCNEIPKEIETIAVIGIGGSSLGAKAVYEFMKPVKDLSRKLYFFESTDPINITDLLSRFDINKTHFLVISKSGSTVETFSIYKYIYSLQDDPSAYTFITDPGSPLDKYAKEINASVLPLPDNVGGRFSVLSTVGLVPLAMCGIDIKALLEGAKEIKDSFFENGYTQDMLLSKAVHYAKNHARYNINCIFAYSETLTYFCQWYVQIWGESLAKHQRHSAFHVGLTPIGLIGPKDQHSFLQLIMQGTRNKSVTFIKIEDFHVETCIRLKRGYLAPAGTPNNQYSIFNQQSSIPNEWWPKLKPCSCFVINRMKPKLNDSYRSPFRSSSCSYTIQPSRRCNKD